MTERYEIAHSHGPLTLIFRAGEWDGLPFEIRLLRPWYESDFLDDIDLTPQQCLDVAWGGYSIAQTHPADLEQHAQVGNQRGARKTTVRPARSTAPRLRLVAFG